MAQSYGSTYVEQPFLCHLHLSVDVPEHSLRALGSCLELMDFLDALGELGLGLVQIGVDLIDISIGRGRPDAVQIAFSRCETTHYITVGAQSVDVRNALAGLDKTRQVLKE